MHTPAAGAPLRAMAMLAAIWMLGRFIAWSVPTDTGSEPVAFIDDIPDASGSEYISAQSADAEKRDLIGSSVSFPRTSGEIGEIEPNRVNRYGPLRPAASSGHIDRPISSHPIHLSDMQREVVAYRLPSAPRSGQNRYVSGEWKASALSISYRVSKQDRERFGGYFWVFTRPNSRPHGFGRNAHGVIIPNGQYGGSQLGGILSYPLSVKSGRELSVYGRFTAALAPLEQETVALGAKLRPVRNWPFTIHAEQRLDANSGDRRGTAVFVVGGTGPDYVVKEITLETYAQAGYVFGADQTHFFDGSATLQRPVAEFNQMRLSVGAGIWAGGQRHINRLDVGPRAEFRVPLGTSSTRISADWRLRVAGNARPGTGLALTLSTGF